MTQPINIPILPISAEAFASFGQLIAVDQASRVFDINAGYATRFHDLAQVDTALDGGRTGISIFAARPRNWPIPLSVMECHPLGSQAFMPLGGQDWLVVVARPGSAPAAIDQLYAFQVPASMGVNYDRGVWHHPLLVTQACDFLVIDRIGSGNNLQEIEISRWGCQLAE